MLTGVGFGIFGDFVTSAVSERAGTFGATLAGPQVNLLADAGDLTIGVGAETVQWAMEPELKRDGTEKTWNEQTHAGRKFARFAKRYTPGTNAWQIRRAAEAVLWDKLQYLFDHDAEAGFEGLKRAREREGRSMWWQPGETMPERGPDWTNALAEQEQD
jgi:hypothetical protein